MAEVFAPSWWSRRRSFLHRHKNNAKNRFTCDFRLFLIAGACLGFAPLRGTCAARRILRRNRRGENKTSRKKPPPLAMGGGHVAVFAAPGRGPWRSWRSFANTAGGHGGHLRRPTAIWRLKRHNLSFAIAAGLNFSLRLSAWHTTRTRRRDPRRGPRSRHAHRTHGARAGRNARARRRRASYLGSVSSRRRL